MGKSKAIVIGVFRGIILGVLCAILIAVLWAMTSLSLVGNIVGKNQHFIWPWVFGSLTIAVGVVSLFFVPYYSFGYLYDKGLVECESAVTNVADKPKDISD